MIRKLLKLAVFLLIANAIYQIAPAAVHHYEFKDAVQELALFSQKSTDTELVDRVMALADENNIPLDRGDVQVLRPTGSLQINAIYVQTMRFFPGVEYPWQFEVKTRAFDMSLPAPKR